jgi:hypothetical protein
MVFEKTVYLGVFLYLKSRLPSFEGSSSLNPNTVRRRQARELPHLCIIAKVYGRDRDRVDTFPIGAL